MFLLRVLGWLGVGALVAVCGAIYEGSIPLTRCFSFEQIGGLSSAEKLTERFEDTTRESCRFLWQTL
jgi:hypothetical protein